MHHRILIDALMQDADIKKAATAPQTQLAVIEVSPDVSLQGGGVLPNQANKLGSLNRCTGCCATSICPARAWWKPILLAAASRMRRSSGDICWSHPIFIALGIRASNMAVRKHDLPSVRTVRTNLNQACQMRLTGRHNGPFAEQKAILRDRKRGTENPIEKQSAALSTMARCSAEFSTTLHDGIKRTSFNGANFDGHDYARRARLRDRRPQ
jgi:hypothetical protein